MGLNHTGPLIWGIFFSIVSTTVVHKSWLVESTDAEPSIQRDHRHTEPVDTEGQLQLTSGFLLHGGRG